MKTRGQIFRVLLLVIFLCALRGGSPAEAQPFLFVANAGNNTIYQYTSSGVGTLFANTNLNNPQALVLDGAGNLYVANNGNNTIVKFTPEGVGSLFANSGLSGPVGLAFDAAGNLYAANQNNGTIEKFSPSGVGTLFASGLVTPGGLAFDSSSNLFAVADSSIYRITPDGVRTTFATGFSSPTFMAFDAAGYLYVGEYGHADVKRFNPEGVGSVFASSGLNYPYQMAFDTNGNLYVVNHYGNNVERLDPGGVGTVFTSSGISGPNGIAIGLGMMAPAQGPQITSEPGDQAVVAGGTASFAVGATGTAPLSYQWMFNGTNIDGATAASLGLSNVQASRAGNYSVLVSNSVSTALSSNALLTVVAAQPFLFVANAGNNTIYQYTTNGIGWLFANTNLSNPQSLVFDGAGNLYVANNGNNTIVRFDSGGVGSVFASNGLSGPVGLAFDTAGNLYAANQNNGTIEKFNSAGVGSVFFSGLTTPAALAFDSSSNLFVTADSSIYKITPAGVRTTFATGFGNPTFLAFDAAGYLYVGEYANADIMRFTPGGVGSVFASSGLSYPYQMVFDTNGNLLVVNHYGNNVESINPSGVGTIFTSGGISGPNGIAIGPGQVEAAQGPQITTQPADQTVVVGGTASFAVGASGAGPLSYQWLFNGTNIDGATAASLGLSNVQASQAGSYSVLVSNSVSTALSSNALLTVVAAQPFLFVANAGNNTIYQYTTNGIGWLFANTNLSNPQALVFDGAGNLYVANNGNNTIVRFDSTGNSSVFANTGLSGPVGLAFDAAGNLYAANQNNGTIEKFSPAGVGSLFVSGLITPGGLVFDNLGNLFVTADSSIYKITPAGMRSTFATGFSSPTFMAFDAGGNLYVGEYGKADIKRFTPGGVGTVFASSGLNYPYQMAFDTNGNLLVVNHNGNNVESISPVGVGSIFASSGISGPNGIAIGPTQVGAPQGPQITAQPYDQTVVAGGTAIFAVGASGTGPLSYQWMFDGTNIDGATAVSLVLSNAQAGQAGNYSVLVSNSISTALSSNALLSVVPAQPALFVANAGNNSIYQYTSNGVGWLFANTNLSNPQALVFDGAGNLYVANNGNSTIVKFDSTGVGSVFASNGLSGPVGLAFDAAGNLYAANQNNGTIEMFSPSGAGTNFASGFVTPGGLIFDSSSNLFVVADSSVYKITPDGIRTTFATGFSSPTFVAFDAAGNLYVGEYGNGDIWRFTPGGVGSVFATGLNYPYQMVFDSIGNLYVVNHSGNSVESISPAGVGTVFTTSGVSGPNGIAIGQNQTTNIPPVAANISVGTTQNKPVILPVEKLLAAAANSDGDVINLSAISTSSTNGGNVNIVTNSVVYTPNTNFAGSDKFSYSINSARGGNSSAFVFVQVQSGLTATNNMLPPTRVSGGYAVNFSGIPGRIYTVERAPAVSGPWTPLTTVVVGAGGIGLCTDTNAPSGAAFYRLAY
jgi:sugar lactone lactonase YvrE